MLGEVKVVTDHFHFLQVKNFNLYVFVCGTLHLSAQVSRVNNVVGDIWGGICGGLIISGNYFSFSTDTYKACPFKITSSSKPVETGILGFFCSLSSKIFLFERKGDEGGGWIPTNLQVVQLKKSLGNFPFFIDL